MGKIIFSAGSKGVPVGEVIAVIAEEGDDLSKLEMPTESKSAAKEESKPQEAPKQEAKEEPKEAKKEEAAPAPKAHRKIESSRPMFPSAERVLAENSLTEEEISKIKGTGLHGMLTKGDVLAALGKISSPYGSAASILENPVGASGKPAGVSTRRGGRREAEGLPGKAAARRMSEELTLASMSLDSSQDVTIAPELASGFCHDAPSRFPP